MFNFLRFLQVNANCECVVLRKNVGDPYAEVFIDDHDFPSGDQFAVQQNL